jgi:glycosyltransferase involved in cell wall biosynthesis
VLSTGDNNTAYYRHYGVKVDRIFSCPFTVDETSLFSAQDNKAILKAQLRSQYGIAEDEFVLLFVGKLAPWKRPQDLLDALVIAQKKLGDSKKLVAFFAGNGVMRDVLEEQSKTQNIRAIFAGFINVDVLPSIYAMADALVFPSFSEGFGWPIIEAQKSGIPVICSNIPIHREIAGEAAIFVDSKNIDEFVLAIDVLNNQEEKKSLVLKGIENIKKYESHIFIDSLIDLYNSDEVLY